MKKILALVLVALLALSMTAAFAAPTDVSATYPVASLEMTGIKAGNTLTLYKVAQFNLDVDTNEFSYTLATGLPAAYDTVEELAALAPSGYTLAASGSTIRTAADILAQGIIEGEITPIGNAVTTTAGSGDKATITNLPAGWYVAVVNGTEDDSIIYQNMIVNALPVVDTENNTYQSAANISFEVKHTTDTITKGVGESPDHSADVQTTDQYTVGDSVPYEIKTNIPNYPNPSKYAKFVITDTPRNLTDTVSSVIVTVAGDEDTGSTAGSIDGKFIVAAAGNGFTVTFVKDYILAHPGAAVTVNYNAVITEAALLDAETGLTADNTAKITFNPNPNFDEDVEPDDKTEDYTYGLDVLKHDETDGTSHPLTGAKFILYAADGTTVVRAETEVDANGHISWNKLKPGTYKLVETKAPTGYRLDSTPHEIVISSTTATTDDRTTADTTETYFLQKDVPNTPGSSLPSTGGIGTTIFYVGGGLLVLVAVIFLVTKRRMGSND